MLRLKPSRPPLREIYYALKFLKSNLDIISAGAKKVKRFYKFRLNFSLKFILTLRANRFRLNLSEAAPRQEAARLMYSTLQNALFAA